MTEPRVWLLLGRKAGDNTQVRALAAELGWPWEEKHLVARPWELLPHLLLGTTLAGIDRRASSALTPPWPDLVISAGRRNEPVARWVRARSRGRSRLVHVGRPWAEPKNYDLVVTTPQYFLPDAANIQRNRLPLYRLQSRQLEAAATRLEPHLADLPRPFTALLVGGSSGPSVFTGAKACRLGQLAQRLIGELGGSLLISNSARTPPAAWRALLAQLSVPRFTHDYGQAGVDNPYLGMLGIADRFIVTGDSVSMLAEACAMGKPLHIFDLEDPSGPWWRHRHNYRYRPLVHHLVSAWAPRRLRRDVSRIRQALLEAGQAVWLGQDETVLRPAAGREPGELVATARRVRELLSRDAPSPNAPDGN